MDIFVAYFNKVLTDAVAAPPSSSPPAPPPPPPSPPQAPPPSPPPHEAEFEEVGQFILVKNLANRSELNGLEGIAQADMPNGRWRVKLASGVVHSIKRENLEAIAQPRKAWLCRSCKTNAYWCRYPVRGRVPEV